MLSFLGHIAVCNAHDFSRFVPFRVGAQRLGWVRKDFAAHLEDFKDTFRVSADEVLLSQSLTDYRARSEAVDHVLRILAGQGHIHGWREEPYRVSTGWHEEPLFEMDRAAVPYFGVKAFGLHVNGFVRDGGEIKLWIGRRASDRLVAPGKLDNLVAGGQPAGLTLAENLVKEAWEEAQIPAELAGRAKPVGMVSYTMEVAEGLKPDVLFCYDLELTADFHPRNTDGEMVDFRLWPVAEVMERVRESDDFKFNVNLVLIDFFIRHGLIDPEQPDFVRLCQGLRQ